MHTRLWESDRLAVTAVQGMGGIGKTELALQYALLHHQQGTYPGGVCWLKVRGRDLVSQITDFARTQLGLTIPDGVDQVAFCWRRWREGDVLVVLDDVTDYRAIVSYLPPVEPRFKVLMTTRLQLGASVKQVAINVLDETAALDLLKSLAGVERIEQQLYEAKELCRWLGYLPLGLELVGRYLKRKEDLSLSQMQQRLEKQKLAARALVQVEVGMIATLGVAAAFELSWQELSEPAQELGYLLSLFAPEPVPWSLVEQCCADQETEELEETREELTRLSLLQRQGQGSYQLHQLIREFFQAKLRQFSQADALKQQFCRIIVEVAKQLPDSPTQAQIVALTPAMPHVAEAASSLTEWIEDEALIWPFIGLGRFYEGQGAYDQALPWCEQCLTTVQTRLGSEHPDVALSLHNLASLYDSQGRYEEAEPLYQQALALRHRLLGPEHPDTATSLNNLAELYRAQGQYEEAEPLYQQALELRQRLLGPAHPDVAQSLNNLALLYKSKGQYKQAELLYQQALKLSQQLLGYEHLDVATSLNNLAGLYESQGQYEEAEPLFQQVLELLQRLLGPEHPQVATSLNNLAGLYKSQRRYEKAEPLFQQALELSQRLLGNEHPQVALSLHNLAALYESQGRYEEAEPLFQQALELSQQLLGTKHPHVATILNNLAGLYTSQKQYEQAEILYQQALALRRKLLGDEHPHVALSLHSLAFLYESQERYSEAEPLYKQALELRQRLLRLEHPSVTQSLNNLAALYYVQGRYNEAQSLYLKTIILAEEQLGINHPHTITLGEQLASLYSRQAEVYKIYGLYNETVRLLEKAVELRLRFQSRST